MKDTDVPRVVVQGPYQENIHHIYDELARIELLLRAQLIRWMSSMPGSGPDRDWGMVVVSRAEVEEYLASPLQPPGYVPFGVAERMEPFLVEAQKTRAAIDERMAATAGSVELRFPRLTDLFALEEDDRDALMLCLIGELDARFRRLFGYLQNDATRQHLEVELLTQVLRNTLPEMAEGRDLFSPNTRLLKHRLVILSGERGPDEALPVRTVRIDDRIASFLLGSDLPDSRLADFTLVEQVDQAPVLRVREETEAAIQRLRASLQSHGTAAVILSGADPRLARKVARTVCFHLRKNLVRVDVRGALRSERPWEMIIDLASREAGLNRAAILFQGCDALIGPEQDRSRWDRLVHQLSFFGGLAFLECDPSTTPAAAMTDPRLWQLDLPLPDYGVRKAIWLAILPPPAELWIVASDRDRLAGDLANAFQSTEAQIMDALTMARNLAARDNAEHVTTEHLWEAARRQASKRLVAFAHRLEPRRGLTIQQVILPEANRRQLLELDDRIRLHRELLHEKGFERTMRLGKGILALFAGTSGTGKTMAAEALANSRGVDLYKVDLSAVVSKWLGETEKNLSKIFSDAENSNGWLFFDEGESLFGTRGPVNQAQDRYLNLEVNYLLQRIEEFSGVVILATNLRQNIDEAFLRRIQVVIDFPQPNAESRFLIWKNLIPASQLRDFDDDELRSVAARFDISGGNIRNVVLDAIFRAYATPARILTLRHVADALAREYQKLGRPISEANFGDEFYVWITEDLLNPEPAKGAGGGT